MNASMFNQIHKQGALAKLDGAIARSLAHDPAATSFLLKPQTLIQVLRSDAVSDVEWQNEFPGGPLFPTYRGFRVVISLAVYAALPVQVAA